MDWMKLVHGTEAPKAVFGAGDEVRVWFKILEQGKERLGQFEGTVIRCRGSGPSKTFTVRRLTHGEGVERIFPLDAKTIARIEVLTKGRVKRSRLYFLRTVIGKTRISSIEATGPSDQRAVPIVTATPDAEAAAVAPKHPVAAATAKGAESSAAKS